MKNGWKRLVEEVVLLCCSLEPTSAIILMVLLVEGIGIWYGAAWICLLSSLLLRNSYKNGA